MKRALFAAALLVVTVSVGHASATSCEAPAERLELAIESLEIDGRPADTSTYWPAALQAEFDGVEFIAGGRRISYSRGTRVTYDSRCPATPPKASSCEGGGYVCGWPDVAPACTAQCTSAKAWTVAGCP